MDAAVFAAVGEDLDAFAGQVFSSLPRSDQRVTGGLYLRGLMLDGRRKSMQPMAAGCQKASPWLPCSGFPSVAVPACVG